jgi:hypothetical protein
MHQVPGSHRKRHRQQPGANEVQDLNPAQIAEEEQAERLLQDVEAGPADRLRKANDCEERAAHNAARKQRARNA